MLDIKILFLQLTVSSCSLLFSSDWTSPAWENSPSLSLFTSSLVMFSSTIRLCFPPTTLFSSLWVLSM